MEAELVEEMALEEPRRLVGQLPPAVSPGGQRGRQLGDAVRAAPAREAHYAGALALDLDHEDAEHVGLVRERSMSARMLSPSVGRDAARNGSHVLVRARPTRKSRSSGSRPADDDAHRISSTVFGRRHATTSPDPSATPRRISASPMSIAGRDRLVEEQRAVRDREGRHDVGDERDARVAVERQHVEVDELCDRRAEDRQRGDRGDRLPARQLIRQLEERERQKQQAADEHAAGREHRAGRVTKSKLRVRSGTGVRERRQHHGERPCHRPPAAGQVDARQHPNADEAERDADPPDPRTRSWGKKRSATTNAKIGTVACAIPATRRVDVLLAPGDEPERKRGVEDAEHECRATRRAQLRRGVGGASRHDEEDEQEQPGGEASPPPSSRPARGRPPRL